MSPKRILCVGLVCIDLIQVCKGYPKEDSDQRSIDHRWQRGGNASNNCTVLSKFCEESEFFGTVSDDLMAKYALQDFETSKINVKNLVVHNDYDCPFSSVIINIKNGSRTIIHSNKDLPELTLDDFTKLDLNQYKWIHFEGRNVQEVLLMLEYISLWNFEHKPIKTSVELEKPKEEISSLLSLADVVFIGKDYAKFQGFQNKHDALISYITKVKPNASVVVAWGDTGAVAQTVGGTVIDCPAFRPEMLVDTLGAGDTFVATTILCLSRGCDLQQSITTGCRVAAIKISANGFDAVHKGLLES